MSQVLGDEKTATSVPTPMWEATHRPVWVKGVNAVASALRGRRWPRLDPNAMMAFARRRTGLDDFGDDRFCEGLRVLVEAFEAMEHVHAFGRYFFRNYCENLLANRLKIQDDLTRHPEILDVPITAPVFIIGPPRSGTTLLQRLLSADPAARVMFLWETMWPSPPPTRDTYASDPRIERARRAVALIDRIAPGVAPGHELGALLPEEDNSLFAHGFEAAIIPFMFDVPDYARWLEERDRRPGHRYAKQQLQLLSWKCHGDHWVIKAPAHLYGIDAILAVYPDARIVMTHRDPARFVPSVCRLAAAFRGIVVDRIDLGRLGAEMVEGLALGPDRAIEARAGHDPARFFDVSYDRLVADPIPTLRSICEHFGMDFGPGFEANARKHLEEYPQGKRGAHRYALADFGLDAEAVDRHFGGYRAWMGDRGLVAGGAS